MPSFLDDKGLNKFFQAIKAKFDTRYLNGPANTLIEQNKKSFLKVWRGTANEFKQVETKESDTAYLVEGESADTEYAPITHAARHSKDGADPITPTAIGVVGYDAAQSLTDDQKTQARKNIMAAPDGYGLGGYATQLPGRDCNKATFNGWYINQGADEVNCPKHGNTIMSYGTLFVSAKSYTNVIQFYFPAISNFTGYCIRTFDGTTWTPWEWPDPPMELGVEYRTTERYLGKPVYVQAVNFGALPNAATKTVTWAASGVVLAVLSVEATGSQGGPVGLGASLSGTEITATTTTLYIKSSGDYSTNTAVFRIKYTKTTD